MFGRCLVACGVLIAFDGGVRAQERPGAVYVTAGAAFPHQGQRGTGSAPPFPAPAGTTAGWLVGGGVFVSPRVSIEGELSSTGLMKATQSGRYDIDVTSERRDRFVSIGAKWHLPLKRGVRLEPIAGIVVVLPGDVLSQTQYYRLGPTGLDVPNLRRELESSSAGRLARTWNPGLLFGTDLRFGGRRFAFVPGLRFAFTGLPGGSSCTTYDSGYVSCQEVERAYHPGHYPRWTQRLSLSTAITF